MHLSNTDTIKINSSKIYHAGHITNSRCLDRVATLVYNKIKLVFAQTCTVEPRRCS